MGRKEFRQSVPRTKPLSHGLFEARFGDECWWCGEEIHEGDAVGYLCDEISCEECVKRAR